jgi:hypothetical protein
MDSEVRNQYVVKFIEECSVLATVDSGDKLDFLTGHARYVFRLGPWCEQGWSYVERLCLLDRTSRTQAMQQTMAK